MHNDTSWSDATLRATADLTPHIRLFEIVPATGASAWTPGSHVDVAVLVDGRKATRSYSLIDTEGGVYRIAVKREAEGRGGSNYLWSLPPGARLEVSSPRNDFELTLGAPEYLLVAGGIGITPILPMAAALARRGAPMRLVYAARSRRDMLFRAELAESLGTRFAPFAADEGSRLDVAGEIARLHRGAEMYVCGPLRLLEAARAAWAASGRPEAALRFETFGNSGSHAAEAFWVRVPRHGVEVTVPPGRTMLEALEAAGIDMMSNCRRGECGLCAVDVLEVAGDIDHRDVFFSPAQKKQADKICACVSRVSGGGLVIDSAYRDD